MPITGGTYRQRSEEEIRRFLEAELRDEWGDDIDLTESSVWSTLAGMLARLDSEELEAALDEVHQSAYLDEAEGEILDRLVALVGVQRRSATHATGLLRFFADGTVSNTRTISQGTTVQSTSDEPVEYETSEEVKMFLRDDFEDGALDSAYGGDTGTEFNVVDGSDSTDPTPVQGSYCLRGNPVGSIYQDGITTYIGHRMDTFMYVPSGGGESLLHYMFGVQDADNWYSVVVKTDTGTMGIFKSIDGTKTLLDSQSVTIPEDEWFRIEVDWLPDNDGTIHGTLYTDDNSDSVFDNTLASVTAIDESEFVKGGFGFISEGSKRGYWDHTADRAVLSDARSLDSGPAGNVGANTLTSMPNRPSGVSSVTNPKPTGSENNLLTSLNNFTVGRRRENDQELRDRVQRSAGGPGGGTLPAILSELRSLPGAESITVFENKKNVVENGLPPKSFEVVYYGEDPKQDIAESLFDIKGFTARDVGGVNGTEITESVVAQNGQTFTMHWSEPTEVNIDMTLDIVVENGKYVGDDEIRRRIVQYVGGVLPDGTTTLGTGVGEDVYVNRVEAAIIGPDETGVIDVDSSDSSYTPSTTDDSNGLEVVSVGSSEVARTNGEDGSITINVTKI